MVLNVESFESHSDIEDHRKKARAEAKKLLKRQAALL
jgi:hypothetical protein